MKLVKESLITEKKQLQLSAGLAIIQKGAILLGHPKGQKWFGTYSIPKGHVEEGEDLLEAAIRETREEVGITVRLEDVVDLEPKFIDYKDKNGQLYKRVYYFIVVPTIPIKQDQIVPDKTEIDWAGFILEDAAEGRIFWRLKPVLEHISVLKELEQEMEGEDEEEVGGEEAVEEPAEDEEII